MLWPRRYRGRSARRSSAGQRPGTDYPAVLEGAAQGGLQLAAAILRAGGPADVPARDRPGQLAVDDRIDHQQALGVLRALGVEQVADQLRIVGVRRNLAPIGQAQGGIARVAVRNGLKYWQPFWPGVAPVQLKPPISPLSEADTR